jgi:MSHA biogenesis protein MshO
VGRAGFTLIEIVVVLAITAIVASLATSLVRAPLVAYGHAAARAHLLDRAETALRSMSRDLKRALPNSVRVSGGAIEMLLVADGAAYRRRPGTNPDSGHDHGAPSDRLDFGGDASWNLLGRFCDLTFAYGTPLAAGTRVVVAGADTDTLYAQAAAGTSAGAITPQSTTVTILDDGDEDQILLSSAFRFQGESPQQRLYLLDSPVSYVCDGPAGTVRRYATYSIAAAQPTDPAAAPLDGAGSRALVADRVASCRFAHAPATPSRAALVTLELELREGDESARLVHRVHVPGGP